MGSTDPDHWLCFRCYPKGAATNLSMVLDSAQDIVCIAFLQQTHVEVLLEC